MGSMAGAMAAALAGCSGAKKPKPASNSAEPLTLPVATRVGFGTAARPLVMQVVAHPDDDLYFMNPDTLGGLGQTVPLVSVYVTGGGSYGVNAVPGRHKPLPDVPAYVSARRQGLRQAYAAMLGLGLFAPWTRSTLTVPDGGEVEVQSLTHQGRRVDLVFLSIDMHTRVGIGTRVGMTQLWADPGVQVATVVVPGSPVATSRHYSRDQLIETLAHLFDRFRPTVIRTLDPDPDGQVHNAHNPRGSDQRGYSDHPDHTAVALFTWAAMTQWVGRSTSSGGKAPVFLTETYRGYYNQRWPINLPDTIVRQKARYLDDYGGNPDWRCGDPSGCGDYSVGSGSSLRSKRNWVRSTHYRYPTSGPQGVAGPGGELTVYGVLGIRAARWTRSTAGKTAWSAPEDLGGGPLAPALSVVTTPDRRDLLFALRFSGLGAASADNTRDVVFLEQQSAEGPFPDTWSSLGNPERNPVRGRRVGPPTAVLGRDGRVHVFTRNASKGLSTRVRDTAGHWSPWQNLAGGQVQEGLTAAVDGTGRIHVFAAGRGAVHEWAQSARGAAVRYRGPLRLSAPPAEAPSAATAADGSLVLAYRVPETARIVVERLAGSGRNWQPASAVRQTGFGPLALLPGAGRGAGPILAVRTDTGGALLAGPGPGTVPVGAPTTAFCVGRPAVVPAPSHGVGNATGPVLVALGARTAPVTL